MKIQTILFTILMLMSITASAQNYQGEAVNIRSLLFPRQLRHTKPVTGDTIFIVSSDKTTGEPFWRKFVPKSGGIAAIYAAKKKDRLGIIVVNDSIGFDYKKLGDDIWSDTLGYVPYFDSLANKNKKLDVKHLLYKPFVDITFFNTKDFSIKAGVDSVMRFDSWNFSDRFSYSAATGKATYTGTVAMLVKVDAGLNFKWTTGGVSETVVSLRKDQSGVKYGLGVAYIEPSTSLTWMNVDLSRLTVMYPGDKFYVELKGDNDRTVRVRGYLNIIPIQPLSGL